MGRGYVLPAVEKSVAANYELFSLYNNATNGTPLVRFRRLNIAPAGTNASTAVQTVEFRVRILTGSISQAGGGSPFVALQDDPGDAAAKTVCVNGSASLSTGTTVTWEWDDGFNLFTGREAYWIEKEIVIVPGSLLQVFFVNAPVGSVVVNGDLHFSEEGK